MNHAYETVIGLEVHMQLATDEKAFCSCGTEFAAPVNSLTCPFCLGQATEAPQLNRTAVAYALQTALALNCELPSAIEFDRKHYSAPDLPKGYQITQWRHPCGRNGYLDVPSEVETLRIPIKQVHLEEDAGRALPAGSGTAIDFNRAGIPLLEVVTPPVFGSAVSVRAYLEALQLLARYLGVSDARIEQGSLRCEVNISLRQRGSEKLGELCEIKNIGSFSGVVAAITYEEQRQANLLMQGLPVKRETRRWDERLQETLPMRVKEQATDYSYEPEPNLPPVSIDPACLQALRQGLPELPLAKRQRYRSQLGLSLYQANELVDNPASAAYFEAVLPHFSEASLVANWLLTELRALLNRADLSFAACPVAPQQLAELLQLVASGSLSHNLAKELLAEGFASGRAPAELARQQRVQQVSDPRQIAAWVEQALAANEAVVQEYLGGKERAFGYLMGQTMRLAGGQANPRLAQQALRGALASRK